MIYVTVGNELPFDRLMAAVDRWAGTHGQIEIFGQTAELAASNYRPQNFRSTAWLSPQEHRERINAADWIVGHAGTGTIIDALCNGKPVLVMPRQASLRETRNEHQTATVERFRSRPGIHVAMDEEEMQVELDAMASQSINGGTLGASAEPSLIAAIRSAILED